MAPRKRKSEGADEVAKPAAKATRSSARLANKSASLQGLQSSKRKKGKAAADKKEKEKVKPEATHDKADGEQKLAKEEEAEDAEKETADGENSKVIVIEHW